MKKERNIKAVLRKLDFIFFAWLVNLAFPQYYRPRYHYKLYCRLFFNNVIPQKILRINGRVKWPVHFTSKIRHPEKIKKGVMCDPGDSIGVYIQAINGITFGDNTEIGPGCAIISANHRQDSYSEHVHTDPIHIGSHVMIYANTVVLPGVKIGDNVIIGAGSVVTKDIPSNAIAVGNPCRVIKEKSAYKEDLSFILFNRKLQ